MIKLKSQILSVHPSMVARIRRKRRLQKKYPVVQRLRVSHLVNHLNPKLGIKSKFKIRNSAARNQAVKIHLKNPILSLQIEKVKIQRRKLHKINLNQRRIRRDPLVQILQPSLM